MHHDSCCGLVTHEQAAQLWYQGGMTSIVTMSITWSMSWLEGELGELDGKATMAIKMHRLGFSLLSYTPCE